MENDIKSGIDKILEQYKDIKYEFKPYVRYCSISDTAHIYLKDEHTVFKWINHYLSVGYSYTKENDSYITAIAISGIKKMIADAEKEKD